MVKVNAWGRLTFDEHNACNLTDRNRELSTLESALPGLAFGNGRSYGDVCLNASGTLWKTTSLDHFIAFDAQTGVLKCEAGVLLRDIQNLVVPRGWILPVTPGTQMITVGGAIANDIHGKNHHVAGTFGHHIIKLKLARTTGELLECSQHNNADWLYATIGGLGLTGVITEVEIQLKKVTSAWLDVETVPYANLDEFFMLADTSEAQWQHTVSWIDCVTAKAGRGIFMRANFREDHHFEKPSAKSVTFPFSPPISLVNRAMLKPFNTAYFYKNKLKAGISMAHYQPYFYPLDHILEWNRMYGNAGFYQYQCVIPKAFGADAIKLMMNEIAKSGQGSFLAVLKTFGNQQAAGMLSFPLHGVTLALDFPNKHERTHALFSRLDQIVCETGGRIYMAKDARMPRQVFELGYPQYQQFMQYRDNGISSSMSRRLMGS